MPRRLLLLVSLIVATAWVAACGKGAGAAGQPGATAPATLLLAPEDLRVLTLSSRAQGPVVTGSIQPERRADLRAEVSSVVLQVFKENGELVRRGDLLVRLDDTAIRDSLQSAEESVRAISQAFDQAERQVQRFKTLQAQGMTSMQALEDAEVRRNNAQSDLVAARARVVSARQMLHRTEVRAPFDGVASERKVSAGDTAAAGKELVKVIDPRSMRFEGLVSADRMHELKAGQRVSFRVNGYPHNDFDGTIKRIDAAANAMTRQVEVIVAFNGTEMPRVAGLYAEGRIEAGSAQVLTVPDSAVLRAGDVTHVWRVKDQTIERAPRAGSMPAPPPAGVKELGSGPSFLEKVQVQLGERDARRGDYPVLSGLSAGDRVLRSPGATLVEGQKVEFAVEAGGAASAPIVAKP
jgi:membrane fusion protein, multidrug efflux system